MFALRGDFLRSVSVRALSDQPPTWLIYATGVVAILANPLFVPALPEILADMGQPDSRAGLLVAVVPLPGVVVAPVSGILADRFGRRRVLLIATVGFGLAGLVSSVAPNLATLLAARFVQGVGSAALMTMAVVLIADNWDMDERAKILGFHAAAISAGLLVAPLVAGLIVDIASWRWSAAVSTVGLPLAAMCHWLVPDNFSRSEITIRQQFSKTLQTVRRPGITAALSANLAFAAGSFGVLLVALPLFLEAEFDASPPLRGAFLALSSLGAVAAGLGTARVRRVLNVRWTLTGAAGATAISALIGGLTTSAILVAVAIFSFGVASGVANPTIQDVIASTVDPDERAVGLSAFVSTMRLGQALGPVVVGVLVGPFGPSRVMLLAAGALAGLTLVLSLGVVNSQEEPSGV